MKKRSVDLLAAQQDPIEGLKIRRNPGNGFVVIELDYIADPAKRDPAWIAKEKARMSPKQWAVEMERSWETYSGRAVYEKVFFKHLHVLKTRREADPDYPLFRGWDFGGNQSVVICQIVGNRLYLVDELPNGGLNTETFAPKVLSFCATKYGSTFHYIDILDPSALWDTTRARSDSACADVLRNDFGLSPIPASSNDPKRRIGAVIDLMRELGEDGLPNLLINSDCDMTIKGMEGGYHYPERISQAKKVETPVKNLFSHIADALQYIALRLKQYKEEKGEDVQYEKRLTTVSRYRFGDNKPR